MSDHKRNTDPMVNSKRCGAKTRSGKPCAAPAVKGKERCRMHGGARGSGAPLGNQNALKTGRHTKALRETVREGNEAIRQLRGLFKLLGK